MRIAFVVQRYGLEVNGGAELHCRELAERLVPRDDVRHVKIFTTCARDHGSWANHYPAGVSQLNGIDVERLRVPFERQPKLQSVAGHLALRGPRLRAFEKPWLVAQGPYVPALPGRLREVQSDFDVVVFFSYLYYPTVFGLPAVAQRSLFVPTAHDEPALRLRLALRTFQLARALAFNTPEERDLVASRVNISDVRADIVGCGVELDVSARPEERARPYVLYLGRVESAKGVPELITGFRDFRRDFGDEWFETSVGRRQGRELELVLAGRSGDLQPDGDADIVYTGFVSDERRLALLAGCEAVIIPGKLDSLSLSLLEAWAIQKPTLATADCPVKKGHVRRAKAGVTFGSEKSFARALSEVLSDTQERERSAAAGLAYVRENYSWPVVTERFMELARYVARK